MIRPSKDKYYLDIAYAVSQRSNCIKRSVGAIVVVDDTIAATGYNGTPRGFVNCYENGCPRCNDKSVASGTDLDKCLCVHSELNCLAQAAKKGIALGGGTMYTTLVPCLPCAKMIVSTGLIRVVYSDDYPINGLLFLRNANIEVRHQTSQWSRT